MPGYYQKASPLPVSLKQRALLERIIRRSPSQQQHVMRAQIILMGTEGYGNQQIADRLSISRRTVYHWRECWLRQTDLLCQIEADADADEAALSKGVVFALSDAPRPGTPVTYSAETVCQIIAVSCEDPLQCEYPLSHWTPQALRLEVIKRGIVADISLRSVGRFLKSGRSKAFESALLGTSARSG